MRVLVTAASRHGSTAEVATVVGGILQDAGIDTDIREPGDVTSLAGYDGVVIGSGVYMGRWLDPARQLIDRCAGDFAGRSVWLFSSGPLGEPAKPDGAPADAAVVQARTGAIDHRVFAGRLVKSELGVGEKLVVAGVHASYGDFRPWDEVALWARQIADRLRAIDLAATLDIEATPVGA
jgi:menaquinone-dependent protoporphyrinogen oxidase